MKAALGAGLVLALLAMPSMAADCPFYTADGQAHVQPEVGQIQIVSATGTETCQLNGGGTGVPVLGAVCESGNDSTFFTAPSVPDGEIDLLVFRNTVWYRRCD